MRSPWIGAAVCAAAIALLGSATPFWWIVLAVGFLYGAVWARSARQGFLLGGLAGVVAWGVAGSLALANGGGVVARRVAEMLLVGSPVRLVALTALVGGLCAATGALAGFSMRELLGRARSLSE